MNVETQQSICVIVLEIIIIWMFSIEIRINMMYVKYKLEKLLLDFIDICICLYMIIYVD